MILYALKCTRGHEFEAWFANSGAFDAQQRRGLLACPVCATHKVEKALMAPRIAKPVAKRVGKPAPSEPAMQRQPEAPTSEFKGEVQGELQGRPQGERRAEGAPEPQRVALNRELAAAVRKLRAEIEAHSEYVGPRFCEEARKIHHAEAPARGIHGEATPEEAKALHEEGIEFFPLPILPEERN